MTSRRCGARVFLASLLLVFLWSTTMVGQTPSASLTGTVTDVTGAAIPGATIVVSNASTGQSYKAVSAGNGTYTISNISPGTGYNETVSRSGFATQAVNDIALNISTTRTQDFKLLAGEVSVTVQVSGAHQDVTLNTTDATIGNVVEVKSLDELPVQFRDTPAALFYQQPGFTQSGSATGARVDQNGVTLDGLDVSNQVTGGVQTADGPAVYSNIIAGAAPVDSVEEFRGTTAGMTANDDTAGGAQFALVTKSGTNKFHGDINEYHRDTDLEANTFFNNFDGVPRSPLIRNQFGGALGGPLWKNKIFFFFDYDGRRDTLAQSVTRTVPTTSFLNRSGSTAGDVITYYTDIASGTKDNANATAIQGYDPAGVGLSTSLAQTSARYPAPNDFSGDKGDLLNTAGYRFNAPTPFRENVYVGRVDFNLNTNNRFWGRGTYSQSTQDNPAEYPGDSPITVNQPGYAWVVGWDSVWGSNKTNSLLWGENVTEYSYSVPTTAQGTTGYGLDGDPTGGTFLSPLYAGPTGGNKNTVPVPIVRDDFTWQKGTHTFGFGGDFEYPTPSFGVYNDYNSATLGLGGGITGLTDADSWQFRPTDLDRNQTSLTVYDSAFVYGLGRFASDGETWNYNAAGSVAPAGTGLQTKFKYYQTEIYAADTWKVTPQLTLTYGLRYQNFTVPYEVHGIESVQNESFWNYMDARISQSGAGVGGSGSLPGGTNAVPYITYSLGGKANNGPSFYAPDNKDFAPRVAFAWQTHKDGKTVINGGAGIVYDETIINALLQEQASYSYLFQSSGTKDYGLGATAAHSAAYYSLLSNPRFSSLATPPTQPAAPSISKPYAPFIGPSDPNCGGAVGPCGLANGGAFNITVNRNLPTPYNMMFNLGLQQELGKGFLLKISWVNREGRRLLGQADAEQLIDFPDNSSGQLYSQAIANLTTWLRQNPNADPTTAPVQPWFEHVLTANGTGISNTGYVASNCSPYPARGDVADTTQCMSYDGLLPANVGMAAQFSENTFFTDGGFSNYNGLLTTVHKNMGRGLQFDLNYTWSHSIDNVSMPANSYAYNGYGYLCDVLRPRICRADSDFDIRNAVNGSFLYQLPFGRGREFAAHIPWYLDELIGGWEISGLPSFQTGTPYMANSVAFLMSYSNEDPALLVGNKSDMRSHVTIQNGQVYAFKNYTKAYSDYAAPVGFQFGERNNLVGPNFFNLDLGVGKTFMVVPERVHLNFRVDAYNALNHVNFESPSFENNMSLVAPPNEFGVIPGQVTASGADYPARVLQASLRLEF